MVEKQQPTIPTRETESTPSPIAEIASWETEDLHHLYDTCLAATKSLTAGNAKKRQVLVKALPANACRDRLLAWLYRCETRTSTLFTATFRRVVSERHRLAAQPHLYRIEQLNQDELARLYTSCLCYSGQWTTASGYSEGFYQLRQLVIREADKVDSATFKKLLDEVCADTVFRSTPAARPYVARLLALSTDQLFHMHHIIPGMARLSLPDWGNPQGRPLQSLLRWATQHGEDAFESYYTTAMETVPLDTTAWRPVPADAIENTTPTQMSILHTTASAEATTSIASLGDDWLDKEPIHGLAEQMGEDSQPFLDSSLCTVSNEKPYLSNHTHVPTVAFGPSENQTVYAQESPLPEVWTAAICPSIAPYNLSLRQTDLTGEIDSTQCLAGIDAAEHNAFHQVMSCTSMPHNKADSVQRTDASQQLWETTVAERTAINAIRDPPSPEPTIEATIYSVQLKQLSKEQLIAVHAQITSLAAVQNISHLLAPIDTSDSGSTQDIQHWICSEAVRLGQQAFSQCLDKALPRGTTRAKDDHVLINRISHLSVAHTERLVQLIHNYSPQYAISNLAKGNSKKRTAALKTLAYQIGATVFGKLLSEASIPFDTTNLPDVPSGDDEPFAVRITHLTKAQLIRLMKLYNPDIPSLPIVRHNDLVRGTRVIAQQLGSRFGRLLAQVEPEPLGMRSKSATHPYAARVGRLDIYWLFRLFALGIGREDDLSLPIHPRSTHMRILVHKKALELGESFKPLIDKIERQMLEPENEYNHLFAYRVNQLSRGQGVHLLLLCRKNNQLWAGRPDKQPAAMQANGHTPRRYVIEVIHAMVGLIDPEVFQTYLDSAERFKQVEDPAMKSSNRDLHIPCPLEVEQTSHVETTQTSQAETTQAIQTETTQAIQTETTQAIQTETTQATLTEEPRASQMELIDPILLECDRRQAEQASQTGLTQATLTEEPRASQIEDTQASHAEVPWTSHAGDSIERVALAARISSLTGNQMCQLYNAYPGNTFVQTVGDSRRQRTLLHRLHVLSMEADTAILAALLDEVEQTGQSKKTYDKTCIREPLVQLHAQLDQVDVLISGQPGQTELSVPDLSTRHRDSCPNPALASQIGTTRLAGGGTKRSAAPLQPSEIVMKRSRM